MVYLLFSPSLACATLLQWRAGCWLSRLSGSAAFYIWPVLASPRDSPGSKGVVLLFSHSVSTSSVQTYTVLYATPFEYSVFTYIDCHLVYPQRLFDSCVAGAPATRGPTRRRAHTWPVPQPRWNQDMLERCGVTNARRFYPSACLLLRCGDVEPNPGPNRFDRRRVFADEQTRLHLEIPHLFQNVRGLSDEVF